MYCFCIYNKIYEQLFVNTIDITIIQPNAAQYLASGKPKHLLLGNIPLQIDRKSG